MGPVDTWMGVSAGTLGIVGTYRILGLFERCRPK